MTKPEMIKAAARFTGITQADAERVINYTLGLISESIQQDGRCEIGGFGVFKKFRQAAVSRPNPQDRTKIVNTPARNTVKFKPCPTLKAAVQ